MYRIIILCIFLLQACTEAPKGWIQVPSGIQDDIHDIEVIDDQTMICYSYGTGNIYKTIDTGRTWKKIHQLDSLYFEQIGFSSPQNGWLVGSPSQIFQTDNGGDDWAAINIDLEIKDPLIYALHVNQNSVIVAPFDRNGTRLYKTKDNGKTWQLLNSVDKPIFNLKMINGILYGIGHNVIIKNIDSRDQQSILLDDIKIKAGQMRDFDIGENGKLVASNFSGNIISRQADQTWYVNQITENRIRNIMYLGNEKWIATGDNNETKGNLFMSEDNGKSWVSSVADYPDIHRITKSKNRVWAVGKEGLVMYLDL